MLKKTLSLLLKIFLFFAFLELFLWANQQWNVHQQNKSNALRMKEGKVFRIICLGDSNTALGGEQGYVAQLDKILNERAPGMSFEVINKGIPAAASTAILDSLPAWLEEYEPDMVTTMMGANDRVDLLPSKSSRRRGASFAGLKMLGTYRLLVDLIGKVGGVVSSYIHLGSSASKSLSEQVDPDKIDLDKVQSSQELLEPVPDKLSKMMMYGWYLKDNEKNYSEAAKVFRSLANSGTGNTSFINRSRRELADCYEHLGLYKEYMQTLKLLLSHHPHDVYSTDKLQYYCKENIAEKETFDLLHSLQDEDPGNRAFLGLLGMCYAQYGHVEKANFYLDQYRAINASGDNMETRKNYLRLAEMLNQKGLKGVFIEYPARSAGPLRRTFDLMKDKENFIIVDNEERFKDAHDPLKYHEYFLDRNYEDIGHCTPKGDRMLAENVARAILNFLGVESEPAEASQ